MRWRRDYVPNPLGREKLLSAMRVGLQFVRESAPLRGVFLRVSLFFFHSTALLALLPLGMFIDGLSMLLIVGPLFHPVATSLGYDGLWFAILFIKCIEIGLLTPPVGLNVFVVAGLFKDLRVEDVFRRITPFIVAEFVATGILFAFPQIITFLPAMSGVK